MSDSFFDCGDTRLGFEGAALRMRPLGVPPVKHRPYLRKQEEILGLPEAWQTMGAWTPETPVQVSLRGDAAVGFFGQGRTMQGGPSSAALEFVGRDVGENRVVTRLRHPRGLECAQEVTWEEGVPVFTVVTRVWNTGRERLTLDLLTSFVLGGITPYAVDDAPGRLVVHRFRSGWSAEGRLETRSLEELHLERSWSGAAIFAERFGQVGSMPVRGYFPFLAVEDTVAGVVWGARLAVPGSWQMEVFRKDDFVWMSGGLADREFGHWSKTLEPGEEFTAPTATLACVKGNLDELAQRLLLAQERPLENVPPVENDLPIVVNEWCTSWGNPTHESVTALAERLRGTPATYLVIDAGWYREPGKDWTTGHGDWRAGREFFPGGLADTAREIRANGLVPGLWFELETVGIKSRAARKFREQLLHRDGYVIEAGPRRFWDMRQAEAQEELERRVIGTLKAGGFGYIKVDYNETIGIGVDGAESLGEGLREHLEGSQAFFRKLREAGMVVENCSSGGHRLEPSWMALSAMGSFSDAHETREIPILAASLQRLILPRQSQIWAVLRKHDTPRRIAYSMAAAFLGRMCISGDLLELSGTQWKQMVGAMELYKRAVPVIRDGTSTFHGRIGTSWRHPQGWQAVMRVSRDGEEALLVAHTFEGPFDTSEKIPLPEGNGWRIEEAWPTRNGIPTRLVGREIELDLAGSFRGTVVRLSRKTS